MTVIVPSGRVKFNPNDTPEFLDLSERVNDYLVSMVQEGVIKYGQRGELAGKIRLDLGKTYDYYTRILQTDPAAAYILKNVFDEWRESHTGRGSWISFNRAFGLGVSDATDLFADRVDCARMEKGLRAEKKQSWDNYMGCIHKKGKIEREAYASVGSTSRPDIDKAELKSRMNDFVEHYIAKHNISGRAANSIRNHRRKGWAIKQPEAASAYKDLLLQFFQENYKDIIKPDFHKFVTPDIKGARTLHKVLADKALDENQEYAHLTTECMDLHDIHKEKDKEHSDFAYKSDCYDELNQMKKETTGFSDWASKEILRNLWRE